MVDGESQVEHRGDVTRIGVPFEGFAAIRGWLTFKP